MVGLGCWGLLYGTLVEPDLFDDTIVRIEPPRVDDANGSVEVPFRAWPNLPAWVPASDEALPPEELPELGFTSDFITPDAPTAALSVTYPGGVKELRIAYSLPVQDFDTVEATTRRYSGGLPLAFASMVEVGNTLAYATIDVQGQEIDARVARLSRRRGELYQPAL